MHTEVWLTFIFQEKKEVVLTFFIKEKSDFLAKIKRNCGAGDILRLLRLTPCHVAHIIHAHRRIPRRETVFIKH